MNYKTYVQLSSLGDKGKSLLKLEVMGTGFLTTDKKKPSPIQNCLAIAGRR